MCTTQEGTNEKVKGMDYFSVLRQHLTLRKLKKASATDIFDSGTNLEIETRGFVLTQVTICKAGMK